jgi:hypothetical protein
MQSLTFEVGSEPNRAANAKSVSTRGKARKPIVIFVSLAVELLARKINEVDYKKIRFIRLQDHEQKE